MADVKAEVKPEIKLDPAEDGRNIADVDAFDDDTDLQIPPPDTQAWLVKLPKDMWQAWNEIYQDAPDDELIEVGKMRVYHQAPDEDVMKQKIRIRLHENIPQHTDIPKNYDLKLTSNGYSNTVVFSEKDLPGHRNQPFGRSRYTAQQPAAKPAGIPAKSERYGSNGAKDSRSTYRTAIPKQTALAPMIHHEANATPIEDDAYYAHMKRKWDAHVAPKSRTTYIEGVDVGMHPGMSNLSTFNSFGLSARPGRGGLQTSSGGGGAGRRKVVKEKAVRMDQADLIDALYRCFRRYKYWSMKALRTELKQPEAYIKENLEPIATLMRSGDFAMNWVLRPEYQDVVREGDQVKEEVAKVESGTDITGDEMGDDDEEDGGEFEDVKMEARAKAARSEREAAHHDRHAAFIAAQLVAEAWNAPAELARKAEKRAAKAERKRERERGKRERGKRERKARVEVERERIERERARIERERERILAERERILAEMEVLVEACEREFEERGAEMEAVVEAVLEALQAWQREFEENGGLLGEGGEGGDVKAEEEEVMVEVEDRGD
ncbi:hypothetical protein LTR85_008443 [Meristemomyces frigidus]|nr:hypothetical protein LTR85_008443 [Meristemomyces frigidus]